MKNFPLLQSSRIILRQITSDDTEQILRIRQDQSINHYIERPPLKNREEALKLIEKLSKGVEQEKWFYWGICLKETSELIGTICLWNLAEDRSSGETGFELLPDFQNRGLMSEALEAVLEYSFLNLKMKEVLAYTHRENHKSVRLLERFGFEDTGKVSEKGENRIFRLENILL